MSMFFDWSVISPAVTQAKKAARIGRVRPESDHHLGITQLTQKYLERAFPSHTKIKPTTAVVFSIGGKGYAVIKSEGADG